MLARETWRERPETVREMVRRRGSDADLDGLVDLDRRWRERVARVDELKARRNAGSRRVGELFKAGRRDEGEAARTEMAALGNEIKALEEEAGQLEDRLAAAELELPNLVLEEAPVGPDESANRVEGSWGEPRSFDFEPRAHWDLGPELGIVDFEAGARVAGARFSVLRGAGAALERALWTFMLDLHTAEHGYTEVLPPYLVSSDSLLGTGQLPKFADDLFRVEGTDYSLVPTAEVPVTNLHREQTLDEADLPIRYCAFTPCFRAEAGSYGRDVRGLIRQHQFHKVELVRIERPEESRAALDELTRHAERVLELLELPYRRVALATGDLGFAAATTFDLEVWLPGQGAYREISSCSTFTDFQARRARIRYRPTDGGKPRFVHTLNGSGLAVGRTWVAVVENHQCADGSVVVPAALRPYLGGRERIGPA